MNTCTTQCTRCPRYLSCLVGRRPDRPSLRQGDTGPRRDERDVAPCGGCFLACIGHGAMNVSKTQTTLGEAQEAIAALPDAVEYTQALDPAQWYTVQQRCAGTQAQLEAQETARNEPAVRAGDAWTQDAMQRRDEGASGGLVAEPAREWLASIPHSFRLSEYVECAQDMTDLDSYGNLQTYGCQIPVGDQDVAGKKGVCI